MKTIKVIDLLNKIAKGEEIPKKIKYSNIEWEYNIHLKDYQGYDGLHNTTRYFSNWVCFTSLNDEIEIIEEEKEIKKIDFMTLNTQKEKNRVMKDKINELIDIVSELKNENNK